MVIYKTTNLVNGKQYIGRDAHNNPNYYGSGSLLKRAIRKYGKENFKKEILEWCENINHLIERERYWLEYYDAGNDSMFYNLHNLSLGGSLTGEKHPMFGKVTPDHVRKKITESMMGEKNHFYGKRHSQKTKDLISKIHSKKTISDRHKKQISEAGLGEKNGNFKGYIVCVHGQYIGQKMMMKEWCKLLSVKSMGNFSDHLKGKRLKKGIKGNFFQWEKTTIVL
jgi:group I intron endonuclease